MKLKTVEVNGQTYAVIQDGKPVYIEDDGKEVAFDAPGTKATIGRLNGEAKAHREAKEAAEAKLKTFEGITDPEAAKKAIETVKNIDDKKLIDAGQVEKLKSDIAKSYDDKIKSLETSHATAISDITEKLNKTTTAWHGDKLSSAFASSKIIADKFSIPADLVQSRFGTNFKIEDGKIIGYDQSGNKLFSRARPAELATFDEALEMLVDKYENRDHILKGRGGGAGAQGGNGGGNNGKTLSRAEFDKLDGGTKAQRMRDGFSIVD